ncbi:hypothetical protein B0A55_01534 [Friedmanniomyces simplex]|uniref:Ribosomal protein L9 domain-containing protein n=1 Tax=Friedmanniomyces simplex TaxID=329884 RepID=A0A4U0XYN6_9PEZI|nr:hypothetical protein B0A55_01534 [Friedmanniomyces simplex]
MANTSSALPVRLLKNVDTFGRKGAIVPISHGQMRNDWLPRRIAEYVTLPERKTLRANDVAIERDFDFRLNSLITPTITTLDPATEAARGGMTATAKEEASMFQRRTLDPARLSPERSMELLEIFIPSRGLEFYRQPIIEEKEPEPAPAPEPRKPSRSFGFGAGAELMAARAQKPEPVKVKAPEGPQAIYGSVSTHDVLVAVRAALAENEEARMVVLRDEDVRFVDLVGAEETDRVKTVGDFVVEVKVKGVDEGVQNAATITTVSHHTTSAKPASSTRPSLLLLPRELRDMIYQLTIVLAQGFIEQPQTLCVDETTTEREELLRVAESKSCIRDYVALSLTCRQLREEARTCFYGKNTFCSWVIDEQNPPLEKMDDVLEYIRHVVLCRYDETSPTH